MRQAIRALRASAQRSHSSQQQAYEALLGLVERLARSRPDPAVAAALEDVRARIRFYYRCRNTLLPARLEILLDRELGNLERAAGIASD